MKSFSIQEDVPIWRPLLNITKKEIIAFANSNNIPIYMIQHQNGVKG